uniref:E3 ubiquitin-protein ligase RNF138 n=1 Tax=Gopherus agassizii TaxID=38772 RepID=A0A452J6V9_9SAUR
MAEEPATICFNEEDFYCPVCQEVFKTPVRTVTCQHVFCRKCFLTAIRESGTHCPLCRGTVTKKERSCPKRALDVENNMKKLSGCCRCCEKQVRFSRMRHHYKTCKKYQDEYGVPSIVPNFQISQDSTGNSNRSDTSTFDNGEMANLQTLQGDASAHPTFKCPLCQETNLTRQHLLDHCNNRHLYQIVPVICPICVSLPWADPSQVTRNLVSHLNLRHQFDYGEFVVSIFPFFLIFKEMGNFFFFSLKGSTKLASVLQSPQKICNFYMLSCCGTCYLVVVLPLLNCCLHYKQ